METVEIIGVLVIFIAFLIWGAVFLFGDNNDEL
jgi:hypothetical protein